MGATENLRLGVKSSNHTLVFRRIEQVLREDPACRKVFKAGIRAWRGDAHDSAEWTPQMCPGMRLTPGLSGDDWYGPSGFECELAVRVEMGLLGTNADDPFDAAEVVRRAFYPAGNDRDGKSLALKLHKFLRDGNDDSSPDAAETGEPTITSPGVSVLHRPSEGDGKPATVFMVVAFTLVIKVIDTLNP